MPPLAVWLIHFHFARRQIPDAKLYACYSWWQPKPAITAREAIIYNERSRVFRGAQWNVAKLPFAERCSVCGARVWRMFVD